MKRLLIIAAPGEISGLVHGRDAVKRAERPEVPDGRFYSWLLHNKGHCCTAISVHGTTGRKAFPAAWLTNAWRGLPARTLRLFRRAVGKETRAHATRAGGSRAAHIVKLWSVARGDEFAKG